MVTPPTMPGAPGIAFAHVTHVYSAKGTFIAELTVTDEGGKTDTDTISIMSGNTHPRTHGVPHRAHGNRSVDRDV